MALISESQGRGGVKPLQGRLLGAIGLIAAAFLLLVSRLYALQILRGEELTRKGRRNFVQKVEIPHDRGIIYDRYGRILVDSRPSLDLQLTPTFLGNADQLQETLQELAEHIDLTQEDLDAITETIQKSRGLDRFQPVVVYRDLNPEQVEGVEAARSIFHLDGVTIAEGRRRTYRYGSLAAHLLGYVNEIDPGTLDRERARDNPLRYQLGDAIGRAGIERTYEKHLRGVDGYEKIVVDAKGRRQLDETVDQLLGGGHRVEPQPGHNLILTVDLDLQQAAEAAFNGRAGAVVALDPNDGSILAMVSHPGYDANRISGALGKEEKARLDDDELKPWLNRPIQGQYAPGSTFKVVTALAALNNRATSPKEKVFCPGFFRMGRRTWRCHRDAGHGPVALRQAIKVSCDTYFYTMGARLGIDTLAETSRLLGLGRATGVPLRGEQPGLVPDEAFHDRVDKATGGYQRGMVVNTAIGQGSLLVTPMQMAMVYVAVANGAALFTPRVVERIETADFRVQRRFLSVARTFVEQSKDRVGPEPQWRSALTPSLVVEEVVGRAPETVKAFLPETRSKLALPRSHLASVQSGLFAVTSEPGGTGYWRRSKLVSMAGKTGTAQVVRLGRERQRAEEMDYFERDHAWFVAYAPAEDPQIVVAVINEHSGHGGSKAGPIAVKVIDAFVELQRQRRLHASVGHDEQGSGEGEP